MAVAADMHRRFARIAGCQLARLLLVFLFGVPVVTEGLAAAPAPKSFVTPEDAVNALVQAVKTRNRTATLSVLGDAGDWLSSGDATADRATVERFLSDYEGMHTIVRDGDKAKLMIGSDEFPFAFPLVKRGDRWRFDTASGKEELLARRIGANELSAIKVTAGDRRCGTGIRFGGPSWRWRPRVRAEVGESIRQARRTVLARESR